MPAPLEQFPAQGMFPEAGKATPCPRCKGAEKIRLMMEEVAFSYVINFEYRYGVARNYYVGCWACRTRTLLHKDLDGALREWNDRPGIVTRKPVPGQYKVTPNNDIVIVDQST